MVSSHGARVSLWYRPAPIESILPDGRGEPLPVGRALKAISWNIQFSAGRSRFFFYDGGPDSLVSEPEVSETLRGIVALLRREDADLVLLQEVDRHSKRTCWIDQHTAIREALAVPCAASTPYFKVPFVPVPPHSPMGQVEMHLSIFSRYQLQPGRRIALAGLQEPIWRRAFNLRRALMHMPMICSDGEVFDLFQTHLSAFSRGDGTLSRQVDQVLAQVTNSRSGLLAGDFNSLPPGDDPKRLGLAQVLYSDSRTPVQPLLESLTPVFPPPDAPLETVRTYVPWGSDRADRTLDYVMGRGPLTIHESTVLAEGAAWSDHLPLRTIFELPA